MKMDELPEVLTRLNTRLDALENRVVLLEHPSEALTVLPAPVLSEIQLAPAIASSSFAQSGATFPVLGKAMLGLAGAYLLRYIAESGSFPKLAAVALAIAYALAWLIWAARVPVGQWFASTIYAGTSALILVPMLWELTLSFNVLVPTAAATVLGAFAIAAYALAWKRNLTSVIWVESIAVVIASIALFATTHDMMPFIAVLLLMAFLSEAASYRNRWLSVRPLVAVAVDIAVWALIFTYSSPQSSRADYPSIGTGALLSPAIALFLIYGTSVALRTLPLRSTITLFEAGQAMIAFLLAFDATLHFAPSVGATLFGSVCLLLSPPCYAAAFGRFNSTSEHRNFHLFATWSVALFLLGCFLCLTPVWIASCLGLAAITATLLGAWTSRLTLAFHGFVYLIAAAFASGLSQYSAHAMAGAFPSPPSAIIWVVSAAMLLCYAVVGQIAGGQWKGVAFQTLSATMAVVAVATALVSALVWLTSVLVVPGRTQVAVIRTLTACALALALAYLGPRWQRFELVWVTYATLAFVAAKLLFEDLRQGHPEFIAASIFLYAVTLILVPQLVRKSSSRRPAIPPASR